MRTSIVVGGLLAAACAEKKTESASQPPDQYARVVLRPEPVAAAPAAPPSKTEAAKEKREDNAPVVDRGSAEGAEEKKPGVGGRADEPAAAPSRAWFPETFLFQPLVVTDEQGAAKVTVRVPDRLTTWRVLALAHSRAGAQAGSVASFLGTLDTYVDPVVPAFLMAGDAVKLPVQVVNTTAAPVAAELRILADNARVAPARLPVTVPARGSVVAYVGVTPERAGTVALRVALGDADAVVRTFPVAPAGRAVTSSRGGTLAAPRGFALDVPAAADPTSSEVRLLVYPGALGILRAELAGSLARSGVADDAYTLYLAGHARKLLAAFGDEADAGVVRELSIVSGQRSSRHARTLDVPSATLIAAAALAHPDNPVLTRLGERAIAALAKLQRPDGTFGGADGWTLQRMLVATAEGVRAIQAASQPEQKQRAQASALRAQGAVERNLEHIDDGYTAAAILAGGAVTGALAERLRAKVRDGIVPREDGARVLGVADGVVRADGTRPSEVEATAMAVLALADGGDPALLADLGTAVLGGYDPRRAWGDGRANLVCLQAVLKLFAQPVPPGVKVALLLDDRPVAEGVLERERLREVLVLSAPAPIGRHQWKIVATPPVPGLAYSFTQVSYVPWEKPAAHGVELAVVPAGDLRVGRPADIGVRAAAPSGNELTIQQGLPAGVQVDGPSLDKLVSDGALASWHAADGSVELVARALEPGATLSLTYRVIPTLAGTLHSRPATLRVGGSEESFQLPPAVWTVR